MFGEEESMNKNTGDLLLDEEYKKSLRFSIFDGVFYAIMFGIGEYYLSAYAVFLGATAFQLGFFGSLPYFFGSCVQLWSSEMTNFFKSRKRLLVVTSYFRTFIWIPIILSYFMGAPRVWILIVSAVLYVLMYYVQYAPWLGWMGDIVDEEVRPRYFAIRTRVQTFMTLVGIVSAGLILEYVDFGNQYYNFIFVFVLAAVSSFVSGFFVSLKTDVSFAERSEDRFKLGYFSKRLLIDTFGKYTVFNIIFFFGIYISAPFFIAFKLTVLNFTYLELMIALSSIFLTRVLFFKPWASLTEKYGNINVLLISIFLISVIPFGWIFATMSIHVYLLNLLAGVAWAGFDILNVNVIYETVKPSQRARSISYLTFYKGLAILAGAMTGSMIMSNFYNYNTFFLIFFVSAIVRLASVYYFRMEVKEIRKVDPVSHSKVLFQLFSSLPRDGSKMAILGYRNAKSNFIMISDQSKRFLKSRNSTKPKKRKKKK